MTTDTISDFNKSPKLSVAKLTGLWAFSECALGGLLHLFQLPFSGFFLAAFAVVIICCIYLYSPHPMRDILYATIVAMTVKLVLSPHTPVTAYVAVGFQGLSGALICSLPLNNVLKFPLLGVIALVESALQKVIILTILFGKSMWDAIDALILQVLPGIQSDWSVSATLILLYAVIYAVWGLIVGLWASNIPKQLANNHENYSSFISESSELVKPKKKKLKTGFWLILGFYILIFIAITFYFPKEKLFSLLLRPLLILIVWYFLINPIVKWLINSAYSNNQGGLKILTDQITKEIPQMRYQARIAYHQANAKYSGIALLHHFILNLIYLICLHDPAKS